MPQRIFPNKTVGEPWWGLGGDFAVRICNSDIVVFDTIRQESRTFMGCNPPRRRLLSTTGQSRECHCLRIPIGYHLQVTRVGRRLRPLTPRMEPWFVQVVLERHGDRGHPTDSLLQKFCQNLSQQTKLHTRDLHGSAKSVHVIVMRSISCVPLLCICWFCFVTFVLYFLFSWLCVLDRVDVSFWGWLH